MAAAVHLFERTTARTTATDTNFVTAITLSAAELAAAGFANSDEVVVFVWALLANAGTSETSMRVTYNGSVITNANTPRVDFGAAAIERNIEWMGRLNLATLADLDLDVASSSTTDGYMERAMVAVVRLADFGTEGTDWVWNKSTTNVAHTTTYSATNRAAVTIPASSGTQDWVIWGYIHGAMDSDTVNFEARLMVDGALQAGDFSEEAESTTEEKTWLMNTVESLTSSTHSVTIESRDDTATAANDHRESALFAFRKDVWADIYAHIPGTVSMANASDVQVATITDTLSASQDLLLYGEGNINLDTISTNGFMWIRQGGSTIIEPVIDDGSGLSNVRAFDATDEPNMSVMAFLTGQSGTMDLDLFAHHTGGATENLLQTSFLVWGMELAASPATAPELQVSGLVIEMTYVVAESSAQVIAAGVASEAGTAHAVLALKPIRVAVGVATETGTAQAVGADKLSDVVVATEVGSAQDVPPVKPIFADVVVATEVGSAQAVAAVKPILTDVGAASEVGSAQVVDPVKAADVVVATEVGSAQTVLPVKPIFADVGAATEVGSALEVDPVKPILTDVGVATEVGSAQAVEARLSVSVAVVVATEVGSAHAVIPVKPVFTDVGTATEVGSAQEVDPVKPISVDVSVATEVGSALEVDPIKPIFVDVGSATEVGSAQAVGAVKPIFVDVVVATEAESGAAVEALKRAAVGVASESEVALFVSAGQAQSVAVTGATEVGSAQAVGASKPISVAVVVASESSVAQVVSALKPITVMVGSALEAGMASVVLPVKPIAIDVGSTSEVESVGEAVLFRSAPVGVASETELAVGVDPVKPIFVLVAPASETELAIEVAVLVIGEVVVDPAAVLLEVLGRVSGVAVQIHSQVFEAVEGGGVSFKPVIVVKESPDG